MTSLWPSSLGKATITNSMIQQAHFYGNMYEGSYEGSNVGMNKKSNDEMNKNYGIFVSMIKYWLKFCLGKKLSHTIRVTST